jgi:histidyl-tRNA synthetase
VSLPRGLRDYSPQDAEKFELIRNEFVRACSLYGFKMMEPSPLEMLETLEAKSGPQIRDEIYYFKDKGGRDLGLRFDLTVGMTRYVCSDRSAPLPVKLAAFAGVFRYDEPQHGRYRWFYQWDVECYGSAHIEADAEMISFTSQLLKSCGLEKPVLKVGDKGIVQEYIEKSTRRSGDAVVELMRLLDKVDKRTKEQLTSEYTQKGFTADEVDSVLKFGELEGSAREVISRVREQGLKSVERLEELSSMLKSTKTDFNLSLRIVRGIDYYTSTVFEAFDPSRPDLGSIAGGGRFDNLAKIFGRDDLPATGVAGGVERLMLALREAPSTETERKVYIACTTDMIREAMGIASNLRINGIPALMDLQRRSLSKQLEVASKQGYRRVVIVGPKEYSSGNVVVRNMEERTESTVPLSNLVREIGG